MEQYPYIQFDSDGNWVGIGILYAPSGAEPTYPSGCVACTQDQYAASGPWTTLVSGAIVIGSAPEATLAQQAAAALAAGCQIVSTATAALNGTYACDSGAQTKMGNMYDLIQRAGGAFPGGIAALPWPDISNDPTKARVFTDVTDFLNFEAAIGGYVLALELIVTTNAGTLPAQPVTIA